MLSKEELQQFINRGFIRIPQVLSPAQVGGLRAQLSEWFDTDGATYDHIKGARFISHFFVRYPELRWLLTHPPLLQALRAIMGNDFVFVNECTAHDSFYGSLHADTSTMERSGYTFHWQPTYVMTQSVLYLQDNEAEYGGGIDVMPATHLLPDPFALGVTPQQLYPHLQKSPVPSKAGDLIIFNMRLLHQATAPKQEPVPPEKRKLALFMVASANNEHWQHYNEYLAWYRKETNTEVLAYPPDLLAFARSNNICLV